MRRRIVALLCAAALLPLVASAEGNLISAGFAPGSLWLSKTEARAGETLKIFTVVYDSSASPIEGDIAFVVDETKLGTQHFKLAAGETQILSHEWKAAAGAHTFSATIENVTGASSIAQTQTDVVAIRVAEAAPSPIAQITNTAANVLASSSPLVQNVANTVFNTTEDWRQAGSDFLSKALYTDAAYTPPVGTVAAADNGEILGTSTLKATASSATSSGGIVGSLWHSILRALLLVFNIKIFFYIALLVVLYILYRVVRAVFTLRRPR